MSLHNQSLSLLQLERREEALAASEEAVGIYRQLSQADPDAFLDELAGALNNLARIFTILGRESEADTVRSEAAQLDQSYDR
jgi:tetratricopeptide (TPR) repeat protein